MQTTLSKNKDLMAIATLLFLFVLTQWSSSVYLPIMPNLLNVFSVHQNLIVTSLSIYFVGYAIGQLFWGTLSDHLGRYRSLLLALSLYVLFELLICVSSNTIFFIIALTMAGFTISANTAIGNALIKDIYQDCAVKRIISYIGIAMAAAPVIAPIIGSNLFYFFGWKSIFLFLSLASIIALISFAFLFRKPLLLKSCSSKKIVLSKAVKEILSDWRFIYFIVVLSFSFGIFFSILLLVPFVLHNIGHYSSQSVGIIMFAITLTYIIGAILNLILSKKMEPNKIVSIGMGPMIIGLLFVLINNIFSKDLFSIFNLLFVLFVMFGIGVLLPASKTGAMLSRKNHIGTSASIMKFVQTLGCIILTKITATYIHSGNFYAVPDMLAIMIFILVLISIFVFSRAKFKLNKI